MFKLNYKGQENDRIILIGDHVHDVRMISEINYSKDIKIGFLNSLPDDHQGKEQVLKEYMSVYDVCIKNDGSLNYAVKLIHEVLFK